MRNLLKILPIFLCAIVFGQQKGGTTTHFLINVGYANLNGNYFKLGPEIYLVQQNNNLINLSATANMAYFSNQFVLVPELGIGYQFNAQKPQNRIDPYRSYFHGTFYSARVNVSPWNVTPEIGISILGLVEANLGYSFEFREHRFTSFNGIKFGLTLHIPTIAITGSPGMYPN